MKIIQATREHAADLLKLRQEAATKHPVAFATDLGDGVDATQVNWIARVEDPHGAIFIALDDEDNMIGMTGVYRGHSAKTRHAVTLWGLYVNETYRRTGIANDLFDAAIAWARANEIIIARTRVTICNTRAHNFYKKYGFKEYGQETNSFFVRDSFYHEHLMSIEVH